MTAPLRKIVTVKDREIRNSVGELIGTRQVEVLECSHEQGVKADAFGPYYANSRRCKRCEKEGRT